MRAWEVYGCHADHTKGQGGREKRGQRHTNRGADNGAWNVHYNMGQECSRVCEQTLVTCLNMADPEYWKSARR